MGPCAKLSETRFRSPGLSWNPKETWRTAQDANLVFPPPSALSHPPWQLALVTSLGSGSSALARWALELVATQRRNGGRIEKKSNPFLGLSFLYYPPARDQPWPKKIIRRLPDVLRRGAEKYLGTNIWRQAEFCSSVCSCVSFLLHTPFHKL